MKHNDVPVRYIGQAVPRDSLRHLVEGRGAYADDNVLPRMLHAAFCRSPFAHARIAAIDTRQAAATAGVAAVYTGQDLARHISPWLGVLAHVPARSAVQRALAIERACWQGEPVAMAVAETRAQAEDAVEKIEVQWEPLPAATDAETALQPETPVIHPELTSNLVYERSFASGDVDAAQRAAAVTVEHVFRFDRQTGVTPEPRVMLAHFSPTERTLTVHHSGQTPHVMRTMLAKHLGLDEESVHVISKDVGGSYGVKLHVYGDEIATAAAAKLLGRPVKFVADRLESFLTDIHARCHVARARMSLDDQGRITALEVEDLMEIGAYAAYPRASAHEAYQVINLCGAPYLIENYRASAKVVFQNKNITSQLRGVGHPVTTTICEGLVESAAAAAGLDPVDLRRRNLIPDDAYPRTTPTQRHFEGNSHHACLDKLVNMMDYRALRAEQLKLRKRNVYRGIGIAAFVESTGPGPTIYGAGGAPVSAQESTTVSLEPSGAILCASGVTEQGQGTNAMLAQVTADAVGVPIESVRVVTGDTERTPCGGGTWGSRGAAIGGEATWKAGRALRANLLAIAASLLGRPAAELDIVRGEVLSGDKRISLAEIALVAYYRSGDLPPNLHPELRVTRSFRAAGDAHAYTNGMHGAHLELDVETGFVRLLGYWVAEDCGNMVNPLLVDEQIRGGVAMGLGWALLEQCVYDDGQLLNGTMADYLVPMAGDLPDIRIAHLSTPTGASELGIKGAGESGVIAAPGAVMNAVNDALSPFGVRVSRIPLTPRRILEALQNDRDRDFAHR